MLDDSINKWTNCSISFKENETGQGVLYGGKHVLGQATCFDTLACRAILLNVPRNIVMVYIYVCVWNNNSTVRLFE